MAAMDSVSGNALEFPLRQQTRLRIALIRTSSDGTRSTFYSLLTNPDNGSLDGALRAAQAEVVEQEIFSALIKEASSLPTASAEVSERLIMIDAGQSTELRFELVSYAAGNDFDELLTPSLRRSTETAFLAPRADAPTPFAISSFPHCIYFCYGRTRY